MGKPQSSAAVTGDKCLNWPSLDVLRSQTSPEDQAAAVRDLLKRLLPERADEFVIAVEPDLGSDDRDTYTLQSDVDAKVRITASSGVGASLGLHNYLKQWGGCHVSWSGNQLRLPNPLPTINEPVQVSTQDRFRYYQNVCTSSYSFVWWDWPRWEKEIDWMALNGINLPLAFTGQEAIWRELYQELGFPQGDMDDFFCGPAFLAWNRMGNIDKWAGPLPVEWQNNQLAIQRQILQRMRQFGMIPVLPAFSGHVPRAFTRVFPSAKVSRLKDWGGFNETYSCTHLLDPEDPLFQKIGNDFISRMDKEFGIDHIYNCDVFNEMPPNSHDAEYLSKVGKAVFSGLTEADPNAIWLMQGWLFCDDSWFWHPPQAKALLTSVPLGRMIVLDLQAELNPMYTRYESFYGQPFIWCMLHNFGGVSGLYGVLGKINSLPFEARKMSTSTMIGTGLTMEGIEQNDVIYEFMNEIAWRPDSVDLGEWIQNYTIRRYGTEQQDVINAWEMLRTSVYNCTDHYKHFGRTAVVCRPSVYWRPHKEWYSKDKLFQAWDHLVSATESMKHSHLFLHDLVDVTRQVLQVRAEDCYDILVNKGYKAENMAELESGGTKMVELLQDMETLLATDSQCLLGRWLEAAKTHGVTEDEKHFLEFNARNQLTLWGPVGNICDYAAKQWAGLMKHYYLPRWELFIGFLKDALSTESPCSQDIFKQLVFEQVEEPFTRDRSVFDSTPSGDSAEVVQQLHLKWRHL